ncbi:hypothetical protein EmuJ_000921100 [Echinococcus multilocularis]|uniref:Uncharacterized protein n=1 Tax=Echinococcus multilocularis TaxID=6211 RepID=A0A068Y9R9_ECHMU|nr:hypothetical protein EmuJ_000921100 [Echinococcus multilocularis]
MHLLVLERLGTNTFFMIDALALAVGGRQLKFEHRNLHLSNILIDAVGKWKGCCIQVSPSSRLDGRVYQPYHEPNVKTLDFTFSYLQFMRLVTLPSAQQRLLVGVPSKGALGEALKWIRVQAIVTNTMTVSAKTPKVRQEEILSLSAEPMSAVNFIRLAKKRTPYLFQSKNYQRGCQT